MYGEMMWNHRIVSTVDEMGNEYFELSEVYYDRDGHPYAYGDAKIGGDYIEDLHEQVELFKKSLELPILRYPENFTGDVNK
jgi:hypothetical protein